MNIGKNIKELRTRKGFTQKDLAEKLNVTPQAVSRWELDTVEPSLDTIKDMCELFDVTTDQLMSENLDIESLDKEKRQSSQTPITLVINANDNEDNQVKEEPIKPEVVTKPVEEEAKPIGHCERCGKLVYEGKCRVNTRPRSDKVTFTCPSCLEKENQKKDRDFKKFRLRAYIVSAVVAVIVLALFLTVSIMDENKAELGANIGISIGIGVLTFTTIFCIMMQNNFVGDLWLDVATWGCVKLPGIIFTLDFGGIVFLIVMKILLFLLSIVLVIGSIILATIIAAACSIFAFPFAVYWAHKKPEKSLRI